MQPQGHASSSQHAHGVEILPFVQAQLDLEAAKRREYKRVNTALREQDAAKKKARTETQDRASKTASEQAAQKVRNAAKLRSQQEAAVEVVALRRENSMLKAKKTELERAIRAMNAGESAPEIAKQIRPKDTVYCGGSDPNEVVTRGKSIAEVVCGFRLYMHSKRVYRGRCPQRQVLAYVYEYLEGEPFPSKEKKKEVRKQLFVDGMRVVHERKRAAVKRMLKYL